MAKKIAEESVEPALMGLAAYREFRETEKAKLIGELEGLQAAVSKAEAALTAAVGAVNAQINKINSL